VDQEARGHPREDRKDEQQADDAEPHEREHRRHDHQAKHANREVRAGGYLVPLDLHATLSTSRSAIT
jgi:hypothetical protein